MGFYIRKSVKFGPIRFNISKSGIGISSGIPGARISTGPRGTYINMGKNGVYYRKKIDSSIPVRSTSQKSRFRETTSSDGELPTADVAELVELSNQELITQINARIKQPTYTLLIVLATILVAGGFVLSALIVSSNLIIFELLLLLIAMMVGITGLYLAWVTNEQEKLARITTLRYDLDDRAQKAFTELQHPVEEFSKAVRIWRVTSRVGNLGLEKKCRSVITHNEGKNYSRMVKTSFSTKPNQSV